MSNPSGAGAEPPAPESARFRALVEHNLDAVNLIDESGRVLYANPAVTRILGYPIASFVGRSCFEFAHPDDVEGMRARLVRAIDHPSEMHSFRFRARHADGDWREVEGASINLTADPEVRAIVSSFRDVTDRVRIEEALREGEQRYRTLFENAPVGIGLAAPDGTLLEFNDAIMQPGGYTRDEVTAIGNVTHLYADPSARARILERFAREGSVRHEEVQFLRKDGTPYDALLSLTPVMIDGEPRALAIVEDISARRALEARLLHSQKMEAVGQLAGGVAHDFNNLLTAIRGYADLCLATLPDADPAREFVQEILEASDRATNVTRRLLAFARRERVAPRLVDVHVLITDLLKLLRQLVGERVLLEARLGPDPAIVRIDPALFEQVIVNLAVNARDAMPRGGTLRIVTGRPDAERLATARLHGDWIEIRVQDDGLGMSADVQAHAFEPFFTTKGPDRGTGLGLATCYGLVRQAGGYIDLESQPGRGTTIRILLPIREDAAGALDGAARADGARPAAAGTGETILLVEDEPGVREFARVALQRLGYRVVEAGDGSAGLAAAQAHDGVIDLVLSDLVMPRMTGLEMAAMLRRDRPDLPIVFMSGYADPGARTAGMDLDSSELLLKPFTLDALATRLRMALRPR